MVKISFIIPIYNVESYLRNCLDSIYSQAIPLQDFEVICVNDCSPDESRNIVLDYKTIYSNIVLIDHVDNRKAGGARNTGLLYAKGNYVWFVDADDTISMNAIHIVLSICEKNNLDVLCFNYQLVYLNEIKQELVFKNQTVTSEGTKFLEDNFSDGLSYHLGYAVRAVYRRSLLIDYDICFPENVVYGEDTTFMVEACICSKKVMAITDVLYNYIQRENSSSTLLKKKMNGEQIYESIFIAGGLVCKFKQRIKEKSKLLSKLIDSEISWFVNRLFIRLIKADKSERIKFYARLKACKLEYLDLQFLIANMDRKNQFVVKYPILGAFVLDLLSILYKFKHKKNHINKI